MVTDLSPCRCYETHNTVEDALVAPCECKGDTRYLHVLCLQKWYHSSINSAQTQVLLSVIRISSSIG